MHVGRRRLQPEGGSNLQALSSPGIFASQALARALAEHATCCRRIQRAKLPEEGGQGSQRGLGWPAAVDATFLKKGSSAGRGKGGTKNETGNSAGTTKRRNRQDTQASAPGTGPGRMDQWPPPHSIPGLRGCCVYTTLIWGFFSTRHRRTWILAHVVTKTDYTQTNEQI